MCATDIDMLYVAVYGILALIAVGFLYIIVIAIYVNIEHYILNRKRSLTNNDKEKR